MTSPNRPYQICRRCIMDTSDAEITFDEAGVCNHCRTFDQREAREVLTGEAGQKKVAALAAEIKKEGEGKEFDCLIGVSGGVDSTYVAYVTKKVMGLRPLAVHLDNGWNSELSVRNVERALRILDIPLHTYVINWEEFRNLQLSFLKASVANSEIPTDHAITAILFRTAAEKKIKYVIGGSNVSTEGILPSSWGYDHRDWRHIKALHKRFGTIPLKTYPHYNLAQMAYYIFMKKLRFVRVLNYVPYIKADAMNVLKNELGWEYYGGKHYESIYTRFFQAHILPTKFGFDKRRAHLATLVASRQISRDEALREMEKPAYPSPEMEADDREYVIKKLGLNEAQFNDLMRLPNKNYDDYPSNAALFERMRWLIQLAKRTTDSPRG